MRWYRYVEIQEWLDIRKRGRLRASHNSCGDGKWVARHEAHAWRWGRLVDPRFPGRVVAVEVDADAMANARPRLGNLDGIGEAAYIQGHDLAGVRIVETMECVQ